jgi:hypothetical protein
MSFATPSHAADDIRSRLAAMANNMANPRPDNNVTNTIASPPAKSGAFNQSALDAAFQKTLASPGTASGRKRSRGNVYLSPAQTAYALNLGKSWKEALQKFNNYTERRNFMDNAVKDYRTLVDTLGAELAPPSGQH